MWRYLLALAAALYLGLWFVGRDHGQQRWGLKDAPPAVTTPMAPAEPATEVSAVTPATPLVTVPKEQPPPTSLPAAPEGTFAAQAEQAAATSVAPEPEVFTLAGPQGAAGALDNPVDAPAPEPAPEPAPAHKAVVEAMSADPFGPAAAPQGTAPLQGREAAGGGEPPPLVNPHTIIGRAVAVRKGPSNNELSVSTLFRGDVVEVLKETLNGWVQVRSVMDGSEGYIPSRFLSSQPAN